MKRPQCQAFAKNTQKQCSNKAMLGSQYCWVHYPKKTPILFLCLGVVFTLVGDEAWDYFTTSQEEKEIIELNQKIQEYQDENKRLKAKINQKILDSFDLFPSPNSGIRIYSRQGAISMHYNQALDAYKEGGLLMRKRL